MYQVIHALFCVLKFMLPACRPKFVAVALITSKIERDCPNMQIGTVSHNHAFVI
jgi:hypothetical protein